MPVPVKHPGSAKHLYVAEIVWTDSENKPRTTPWSELCNSALDAIHGCHRFAQDIKCGKAKLGPKDYRISGLHLSYTANAKDSGERLKEFVEIPPGEYPDLHPPRTPKVPHPDFPFVDDELLSQSRKLREASLPAPSMSHP